MAEYISGIVRVEGETLFTHAVLPVKPPSLFVPLFVWQYLRKEVLDLTTPTLPVFRTALSRIVLFGSVHKTLRLSVSSIHNLSWQSTTVKPGYKHIGYKHILTNKHTTFSPKRILVGAKHNLNT